MSKFRRQTRLDGNPRRGYPSSMVLLQPDDGAVFDLGTDSQTLEDLTKQKGMLWLMYGASLLPRVARPQGQDAEDAPRARARLAGSVRRHLRGHHARGDGGRKAALKAVPLGDG